MSEKNILDKTVAEIFLEDSSSMDLSTYTEITDEAAKLLAGYEGDLALGGLNEISEKCAEHLGAHVGEIILWGLASISEKTAEHLAKVKGNLYLDGINEISLLCAKALSQHSNGVLSLRGLQKINEDTAKALAAHLGEGLLLDGLSEITERIGVELVSTNGDLFLNGVTKISDPIARTLAFRQGGITMESLNVELLSNVASYLLFVNQGPGTVKKVYRKVSEVPNGNFKLKSAVLTKDIAAEMVQNGFPREDIMEEFTSLEDCAAEEFGKIKDQACELKLIGLKKLSEKNAEALSRFQGNYLSINTEEISDKAVETLLQGLKCEFCLGNEKITESVANILKTFKGPVLYLGITEISASCAKALAEFRGSLQLNQLKNIPSEALEQFANHSGPELLLNGFEEKIPKCR